ncbi:MAG: sugar phosphate isomerase/epimerase family protein [Beutenbergiaceae bacterium]
MALDDRILCSTITLRHLPLAEALAEIRLRGFAGIDLGALPGVCDHVPYDLDASSIAAITATIRDAGLSVRSVNGDIGDLNVPLSASSQRDRMTHADLLLDLCESTGARALVLPNGRQSHDPIATVDADLDLVAEQLAEVSIRARARGLELWVEAPHWFRLTYDLERTSMLASRLSPEIGLVCDVSHVTASGSSARVFLHRFGDRTRHIHIRDAEPGFIHHSVGRGSVDFADLIACLAEIDYAGALALELETRDIEDEKRATEALRVGEFLTGMLTSAQTSRCATTTVDPSPTEHAAEAGRA